MNNRNIARTTLIKLAVRVGIVIVVMTGIAYFHVISLVTEKSLEKLEKYIVERGQRERSIFKLAEDNHALVKREILQRLVAPRAGDTALAFDRLFTKFPDGVTRNRLDGFDGTRQAFAYIGSSVEIDADIRNRILTFYELCNQFGPAWINRFENLYMTLPENALVRYYPDVPNYAHDAGPGLNLPGEEWVWVADKRHNPERKTVWTGVLYDPQARRWMVSSATPVDIGGRQVATIGQDLTLNNLVDRLINKHLDGAYNILLRGDGRLIAHPEKLADIQKSGGQYNIEASRDGHLRRVLELVRNRAVDSNIVENAEYGEYLAVARIDGPDWYFVTVYPKHLVTDVAFNTASLILLLGFVSLLAEITILYMVLRRDVAAPLRGLVDATGQIASGNLDIRLDTDRRDELGRLARSFNTMAAEISRRTEELRENEARFRATFEQAAVGIAHVAPDGKWLRVNQRLCDIVGYTREELLKLTFQDITYEEDLEADTYEEDLEADLNSLNRLLAGEIESYSREKRYIRKNDGLVWINLTVALVRHDSGKPCYFISVIEDISDRKSAEAEVRTLNAELEARVERRTRELREAQDMLLKQERLATLGQFTGSVAHELRNPLGTISTTCDIVSQKVLDTNPELERALQRAKRSIQRCNRIITELLDYARSGDVQARELSLNHWLDATLNEIAVPETITLRRELDPSIEHARIDPDLMRQVVFNLVDNAIQALEGEPNDHQANETNLLTVSTGQRDGRLAIAIADTGPGIPAEIREKITEPLFSTKSSASGWASPSFSRSSKGTGARWRSKAGKARVRRSPSWSPSRKTRNRRPAPPDRSDHREARRRRSAAVRRARCSRCGRR